MPDRKLKLAKGTFDTSNDIIFIDLAEVYGSRFSDTINSETLGESIALTSNQVKYSPIYEALGGNGVKAA
ncbi:hypothetical protein V2J09_004161 [Rumex salicifolius]